MDRAEREAIRNRNDALREQVDNMLETLRRQQSELEEVRDKLAALRAAAWSSDRSAKVTVNAAGVVVDTVIAPEASRARPETLAKAFTEAAQRAAREVQELAAAVTAPITRAADEVADMPALIPGAPSLRELRGSLAVPEPTGPDAPMPPPAAAYPAPRNSDDDDDWGQPGSWLESVR
jgi:DNA-binding protein YbaB